MTSCLTKYLAQTPHQKLEAGAVAFWANIDQISKVSPEVSKRIIAELSDQRSNVKLIASENYSSLSVQAAMSNLLTDKYAEGYAYHRFYAGCDNVDAIEDAACKLACSVFGCDHAYVQPHAGSDANLVGFWAILRQKIQIPEFERLGAKTPLELSRDQWEALRAKLNNQKLLAMDMFAGGHLTHGYRFNLSAQIFDVHSYAVNPETFLLDYDDLWQKLQEVRPLIFLVGYSAYPRLIDFAKLREMADHVGSVLMVDMAHFAGLVAGKVFTGVNNPVPYANVVTSTTHKTLRGPRGGIVLCEEQYAESVDKGCPLVMGGPLPHVMAAKAVALKEASTIEFNRYAHKIVQNARVLAEGLVLGGVNVLTGGTDNHLVLADVTNFGLTGRQAEGALRQCGLTLNRNVIPFDKNGPWFTSGLRLGTPSVTTLGMDAFEMREIADIVVNILKGTRADRIQEGSQKGQVSRGKFILDQRIEMEARARVTNLLSKYKLYPEIDLSIAESTVIGESHASTGEVTVPRKLAVS